MLAAFKAPEAAVAPIYDARDILANPQHAVGAIVSTEDEELGAITMTNVISRLSATFGEIRRAGGRQGADSTPATQPRSRARR